MTTPSTHASAPPSSESHPAAATPGFVLVIDDEPDIRETLREVIEMEGCSAILASSAREGLQILETRTPCLIILDLLMPGMSGAEMLERMRGDTQMSTLPVLMSTSAPSRAPRNVPILPKPIDLDALFGWIRRACRCNVS